ncbi:endolytic transglycosylase MltG [Nitratifractor sp.]
MVAFVLIGLRITHRPPSPRSAQATAPHPAKTPIAPPKKHSPKTVKPSPLVHKTAPNPTKRHALPPLVYILSSDPASVIESFQRQGIDVWSGDYLFLPSPVRPGWIRPPAGISVHEFLRRINDFPREKTRRVVMYAGDSLDDFIPRFARQTRMDPKALLEEYYRHSPYIEGGILAGYYRLPYRLSPAPAMAYLTETSERTFREISERHLGRYDPAEFRRYLIIASIIQRETWRRSEMPKISAVIYNRLAKNMKLQLDATLNYGPWSHKKVTPERIRTDRSRFNTYRYYGLPPLPLGSVSESALEAAFRPAKTDALYFVRGKNGRHIFSRTYTQHESWIHRRIATHKSHRATSRHPDSSDEQPENAVDNLVNSLRPPPTPPLGIIPKNPPQRTRE